MSFQLQDANLPEDFPVFSRLMFETYEDPPQKFFHSWFPILGDDDGAREAAIKEASERFQSWHTNDPSSYWQKVVDTETGKVVGTTLWNIYTRNPFAEEDYGIPVTWFPENGARNYTEQVLAQMDAPRAKFCPRPHVFMFIVSVHPNYRRKGIGQMLLDWGMKKADEMGVEFCLDATPVGLPLYSKSGFLLVKDNVVEPRTDTPDEAWREIQAKVASPFSFYFMWRPPGGYIEGRTVKPWE